MGDWRKEAERLREWQPRHLLFLCVANSARSQLAEGIARHLAPSDVKISSGGSKPSVIRPQVIEVLSEVGIDASQQYSKGLDDIALTSVTAVITLCQEEVCPVFIRPVLQLHWGLPDPAGVQGTAEEVLAGFRAVRDELLIRLRAVFATAQE
ncbi:MAG: arsenate reductase ArsC [bacterium]|nr:arsenate reductase ArsC [bacterium]